MLGLKKAKIAILINQFFIFQDEKVEDVPEGSISKVLKTMVSPSLLTDPKFLLIGISKIFGSLGFYIPFIFLPKMASGKDLFNYFGLLGVP